MACQICDSTNVSIIFDDKIRNGSFGNLTANKFKMYQCNDCGSIWHDFPKEEFGKYYESENYRKDVLGETSAGKFYKEYDKEVARKISWIGTENVRGMIIADVGCAAGALLDYYAGPSAGIIAIEPSEIYRQELKRKGYDVFSYCGDAVAANKSADLVVSFDVIEHVEDPLSFLVDIYNLCNVGGRAIIGTPTEHAIARQLMGHEFDQFHFRFQHPWILSKKSMMILAEKAGFSVEKCIYKQRYNLSNLLSWLTEHKPKGNTRLPYISERLEEEYKKSCEEMEVADYVLIYLNKNVEN